MKEYVQKILNEGTVIMPDILKVDHLLNHQMDINLLNDMGKDFYAYFKDQGITKIVTVESGGIGLACFCAMHFCDVPVVYAKKEASSILSTHALSSTVHSFTKNKTYTITVDQRFLLPTDRVLIIDDFLANGQACLGLCDMIDKAGATLVGVGIAIEKGFMKGRSLLEEKGVDVHSLMIIQAFEDNRIILK